MLECLKTRVIKQYKSTRMYLIMKVSRKDGTTNEGSEGDDTSRTEQEIKKFLGHVDTK